jgi:hypothetical protein
VTAERGVRAHIEGPYVSRVAARHRKPSRSSAHTSASSRVGAPTRYRKRSPIASALRHKPAWAVVTVAGLALIAAAALAVPHWLGQAPRSAAMDSAGALHSSQAGAGSAAQLGQQAGAGPNSNAMAGSSRLRSGHIARRRHAHASQQAPTQPPPSSGGSGAVTRSTDCVVSPHSCGFPDATNTGADCSSLAPSGSITVSTNGAVVEGRNISGSITVQASNVTIRNDCVTSGGIYPVHFVSGSNLTVENTTITGRGGNCARAVEPAGNGAVMDQLNVSGCEDGIQMYNNDVLENSYIHDLAFTSSSHNDGVQQNAGHNDVVKHNTIFNPHNQTSCVNFTTDFAGISDITITGNLLNGGNYTVYSRSGGHGNPTGVSVTGNHFGSADVFGLVSADGSVAWSGNVADSTGQAVGG